jgi:hypothetical protein
MLRRAQHERIPSSNFKGLFPLALSSSKGVSDFFNGLLILPPASPDHSGKDSVVVARNVHVPLRVQGLLTASSRERVAYRFPFCLRAKAHVRELPQLASDFRAGLRKYVMVKLHGTCIARRGRRL